MESVVYKHEDVLGQWPVSMYVCMYVCISKLLLFLMLGCNHSHILAVNVTIFFTAICELSPSLNCFMVASARLLLSAHALCEDTRQAR